jgi:hypothetical protein
MSTPAAPKSNPGYLKLELALKGVRLDGPVPVYSEFVRDGQDGDVPR